MKYLLLSVHVEGKGGIRYCASVRLWLFLPWMEVKITLYVNIDCECKTASSCNLAASFNICLVGTLIVFLYLWESKASMIVK